MLSSFVLGKQTLKNNLIIAPMAGVSDRAFREICTQAGAGLTYTEMVSVAGVSRNDKNSLRLMHIERSEGPVALQLFGNKPEEFAEALNIINEHGTLAISIDINMGCPVKKVIQAGCGASLMRDLPLAKNIIKTVVQHSHLPVTVKFRSGWSEKEINYVELGKICQDEGALAVCLHPRTRAQAYTGHANWDHIKNLASILKIPVIGSGDITSIDLFKSRLNESGCAAIMIGRGAMGNPWLIKEIVTQQALIPDPQERITAYLAHTQRMLTLNPQSTETSVVCEMRKFAHRYINGFRGAAHLRQEINKLTNYADLSKLLNNDNPALFR